MTEDENYLEDYAAEQHQDQQREAQYASDPGERLVEKIQFGSPSEAAQELRGFLGTAMREQEFIKRKQQELANSQNELQMFLRHYPDLNQDAVIQGAVRAKMMVEQRADLDRAYGQEAMAEWIKQNKRQPTDLEIADWHLQLRSVGNQSVRPVRRLLEDSVNPVLERMGVARPPKDATKTTQERINATLRRRGLPERTFDDQQPTGPNLQVSPADYTSMMFGSDQKAEADTEDRQPSGEAWNRSSAIERMMSERRQAQGREYRRHEPSQFTNDGPRESRTAKAGDPGHRA